MRRTNKQRASDLRVMAELHQKGWSIREIASRLNLGETTVRRELATLPVLTVERATPQEQTPDNIIRNVQRVAKRGRISRTRPDTQMAFSAPVPPSYEQNFSQIFNVVEDWRLLKDPSSVVLILARHSPEFSKAWWDLLLMSIGGWEIKAKSVKDRRENDEQAQKVLDAMLDRIGDLNGSLHNIFTQIVTCGFFRGAFAAELVLDSRGRSVVDIAVIDPAKVRFRPVEDPVRGDVWELGQQLGRDWVSLEHPTIKYLPLHPLPSDPPYGTPPVGAAVMPAIFLLGMFYDIKRVIEKQGFGRLDVTILPMSIIEKLGTNPSPAMKREAIENFFAEVEQIMEELGPDDVFVHTDDATVNRAPGAGGDAGLLLGIDKIIDMMEKQVIRALKSMPLIQGVTDSVSEGNANRQWEVYAKGVRVIQQNVENLISYLLELGLAIEGVNAFVEVRFAEIRAVDEYREAQMRLLKTQTAVLMETAQYMDEDEAAAYANGKHGIPESLKATRKKLGPPKVAPANNPAAPESNNGEAKQDEKGRALAQLAQLVRGEKVSPEGADDNFPPATREGEITEDEIEQIKRFFYDHVPVSQAILDAEVKDD